MKQIIICVLECLAILLVFICLIMSTVVIYHGWQETRQINAQRQADMYRLQHIK